MESKQTRTFVRGAAILGAAGVICKIIGAVYRIPLTNLIGAEAMGIYSKAYMIYSLLLVLTASGIPAAVSKLVAEYAAADDYRNARRTLKLTRNLLLAVGGVCTLIMLLLSDIIARSLGISEGEMVIICIAPSLLLSAVSAYRGYFQGLQDMAPTALSQLIGQLAKLTAGLILAAVLLPKGPVYAASGALLGVSLSELLSLIYLAAVYRRRAGRPLPKKAGSLAGKSNKELLRALIVMAVPLTIGGALMPLINTLDAYLVTWCLKFNGYSEIQINSMYGVLSGMVIPVANMPTALTLALSASLVPAISRARARRNGAEISRMASLGLKLSIIIGLPVCIGLIMLARPVLELLYSVSPADQSALETFVQTMHVPYRFVFMQMELAQSLMLIMSPAMLLLTSVQTMTGALQGAGRIYIPIKNLLIGGGVKLALSAVLLSIPSINILGAPLGTLACYLTAFILDYIQLRRRLRAGAGADFMLKPLFATAVMALVLYIFKLIMGPEIIRPLAAVSAVAIGAAVYLGVLFCVRPFSLREMAVLRGPRASGRPALRLSDSQAARPSAGVLGEPPLDVPPSEPAGVSGSPSAQDAQIKSRRRERLNEFDGPGPAAQAAERRPEGASPAGASPGFGENQTPQAPNQALDTALENQIPQAPNQASDTALENQAPQALNQASSAKAEDEISEALNQAPAPEHSGLKMKLRGLLTRFKGNKNSWALKEPEKTESEEEERDE